MKYKSYSKEFKLAVVNEYLVVKKLKVREIQNKYKLSTRVLIYNWVKSYQKNNYQPANNYCQTAHRIDKEDIEKKLLKQENEKLRKELLKEKVENEFLKEWQACEQKLKNEKNNLNSKFWKHLCFQIVHKYYNKNYAINKIISFLPISKVAYYKWIKKGKKQYQTKIDNSLLVELNKIIVINNQEKIINITSLEKVRLQLKKNNSSLKCSKLSIKSLLQNNNTKLLIKPKKTTAQGYWWT